MRDVVVSPTAPDDFKSEVEVAACYIVCVGHILMLKRSAGKPEGERWGVPAGKVDVGETLAEAAKRELYEETGVVALNLQEVSTLFIRRPQVDFIYHSFMQKFDERPKIILNDEHTHYLWVPPEQAHALDLVTGAADALNFFVKEMPSAFL